MSGKAVPRVSVVVPTYQRCASVLRLLRALARQTLPADTYEVIVSVDGSSDGTLERVRELVMPYPLTALWQPNRGRAAACNAGLRAARGGLIVLLDDDMEPAPGLLAAHERAHASGARLGIVGAAPVIAGPDARPVQRYLADKFNQHLARLGQPGYRFALRDFYSGNFSIEREVLLRLGGFDEDFRVYGNEDLELSVRLTRAGVRLVYCAGACARQHHDKDFAALARDYVAKGRTSVLLAAKHPETWADLRLSRYADDPLPRRLVRAGLLGLMRVWPGALPAVISLVQWLERGRVPRPERVYGVTLDSCYWLGVRMAQCEQRRGSYSGHPATRARSVSV